MMNSFKCVQEYFEINTILDREPMKLLQNRSDVVDRRGPGDDTGSRILDTLKLVDGFLSKTKKK